MDSVKKASKIISLTTLIIVILSVFFAYKQYDDYRVSSIKYQNLYNSMVEQRNIFIKTVLMENQEKADLLMNKYADELQSNILTNYNNKKQLEDDILKPSDNSKLTKILNNALYNSYINVDSNSNKPFVASMSKILWNRSIVIDGAKKSSITWEDFIVNCKNKDLAKQAVSSIQNLNKNKSDLIFWQAFKSKDEYTISSMKVSELISLYDKYGLDSLKSYEILVPVYITKDGDIFNIQDLDEIGYKVDNYKIILIQRLNVYDILKQYDESLTYYNSEINKINEELHINEYNKLSNMILSICILIVSLIISVCVQNKIIKSNK